MTPKEIIDQANREGLSLRVQANGNLWMNRKPSADLVSALKEHKAEVIRLLQALPDLATDQAEPGNLNLDLSGVSPSVATRAIRANSHNQPATLTASGSPSPDLPELVDERAAIREYSGNQDRAAAIRAAILEYHPDGRCYRCFGRNWWASIHGEIICERCHEPISEAIVELRVSFDQVATEKAA